MKCFKVNLDYEAYLFDQNYRVNSHKSMAMIKEFEYVFFLVNNEQCFLKNYANYQNNYLEKLQSLGFFIPEFSPEATSFINWWGSQNNKVLEQKLNSKITSAELALKNHWGMFHGKIVSSKSEAQLWMNQFPIRAWILKNPFGVSGSGNTIYIDQEFSGPHLLEPIHQRVFDIGTTFEIVDGKLTNWFMVENTNSKNGSFKGGIAAKNVEIFKKYILDKYNFDLSQLEILTHQILKNYLEIGASSNLQIDSFIYLENGILKLYPLVEVNYRKTMGLVLQRLALKFNHDLIQWKITHTDEFEQQSNWIKLSPNSNRFKTYLAAV